MLGSLSPASSLKPKSEAMARISSFILSAISGETLFIA
jgi:hypothetical protein